MANTTYTSGVTTIGADWLNDLNRLYYTIFGDPADIAAISALLDAVPSTNITAETLRLTSVGSAGLTSTDHPYQAGLTSGTNVAGDGNSFQARDGGSASDLFLNHFGGNVIIALADINGGSIDGTTIGGISPAVGTFSLLNVDNLRLDGNTISSTNTNGDINLTPNGSGAVVVNNFTSTGIDDNASSTAVTIDSSGNVGIGYTSVLHSTNMSVQGPILAQSVGVDGTPADAFLAQFSNNDNEHNVIQTRVSSDGNLSGFRFKASDGAGAATTTTACDLNRTLSIFYTGGTERVRIDSNGNVVIGTSQLADAATGGFLYIPGTTSGAPSGSPAFYSGRHPIVFDDTNDDLYIHNGSSWVSFPNGDILTEYKTADTGRSSDTTLSDDPHLAGFSLGADTYIFEGEIPVNSTSSVPDLKFAFQVASGTIGTSFLNYTYVDEGGNIITSSGGAITTTENVPVVANQPGMLKISGIVTVTAAAVLDFQWAQNTSDATAVTLGAGGHITFRFIGD